MGSTSKRCLRFCAALLAAWLGLRLVLPLMYPFLLGALLALGAEGAADFLERRLRLPRFLAAGLAVGALVAGLGGCCCFWPLWRYPSWEASVRPCPPSGPPSGPGWRCWRTGSCPWGPVCQATGRP